MIRCVKLFLVALVCLVSLDAAELSERMVEAEKGYKLRWERFEQDYASFTQWKKGESEQELHAQFDQLEKRRMAVYFIDPPEERPWESELISQELYKGIPLKNVRYPSYVNFGYNLVSEDYNANIISIHGLRFLALEAPLQKNIETFFKLLVDYDVSSLVRLTPRFDQKRQRESAYPYWEGRLDIHPMTGGQTLRIAEDREISYFQTDSWVDCEGESPQRVIALVKALERNAPKDEMIAIHCRIGVGRTGTLIAAYTLLRDIDRQLASGVVPLEVQVSIERVVYELSLQRPFFVTYFAQYKTLHEVVRHYVESKHAALVS